MGVRVVIGEDEHIVVALRRLKKLVSQHGTFYYLRKRQTKHVTPSAARRWQKRAAKDRACKAAFKRRRELGIE
jgi:ribosomal protein S21